VLVEIALQTRLEFKQINQNIHVQKSKRPQPLEPILVLEERIAVSGTVTDENGAPMPGVTVIVEGTNAGTVTDLFGNYTIEVPEGGQLVFSFLGYESVTIDVENQTLINLTMIPVPAQLDEVVVTAFGIEKEKRQLVYSTQEVEGKDISAVGNTSLLNGLQGKI